MKTAIIHAKLVLPEGIREGSILMENERILEVGDLQIPADADVFDASGAYAGPGLVDIHCHGYANAVTGETYSAAYDPSSVAKAHLRHGTTSITPSTAYSWTEEMFLNCIAGCKAAMHSGMTTIEGIHFEGPFTNPKYGANAARAWQYSAEIRDRLFDAAGDLIKHCTYAPEMPCGEEFELFLKERHIVRDIGHTELSPAQAKRAVDNGASIVTHLYDAMGCWRGIESLAETGIMQETAADILLSMPGLYYELICDSRGIHVKPQNIRLAYRAAGAENLILITDCDCSVSHKPDQYPAQSPMSSPDLNYNTDGELCGSRLVLSDACQNFMKHTGADIRTAFLCGSANPAKALHMDNHIGSITPGRYANILITDRNMHVRDVFFRGIRQPDVIRSV